MANRIQLRRDTAANWTRENPVLSQGEPGFDLTANKLKVGDGATAWADLDYASGSGASFDYSTLQEGISIPFGGVTSITGNHDTNTGVGLTSESWVQLMWVPDTSVVTVDEISDGANVYNWAYVDDQGFFITNHVNTATHQWQFNTSGHLTLPSGGLIKNSDGSTYGGGGSVGDRLTAGTTATLVLLDDGTLKLTHPTEWWSGAYSLEIQKAAGNYHTFKSSYGLSLQATPVPNGYGLNTNTNFVDIFHDGVSVNVNDNTWGFGTDGNLTFPNGSTIGASDPIFGVPITTTRGSIFLGNQAECLGGENHFHIMKAGQQEIDLFLGDDNNYVKLPSTGGVEISSSEIGAQHYWQFGGDGNLTLPAGGDIVDSNGTSVLGGNANTGNFTFSEDTITNDNGLILSTDRGTLAIGTNMEGPGVAGHFHIAFNESNSNPPSSDLFLGDDYNYVKLPGYELNPADYGVEIGTHNRNGGSSNTWRFGTDGTLTLPAGGDIKDSTGTSVLGGGGGSTLVNGSKTVSLDSGGNLTFADAGGTFFGNGYLQSGTNGTNIGIKSWDGRQKVFVNETNVTIQTVNNSSQAYDWTFGTDGNMAVPGDITKPNNQTALFKTSVTSAAMGAEGGGLLTAANFTIRTVNNTSTYTLTFASSTPTNYSWSGFGMDMSTGAPINVWGPKFTATATQDYTLGTFATVGDTFQIILTDYVTGYLYRITSVLTTTSSSSTTIERIA